MKIPSGIRSILLLSVVGAAVVLGTGSPGGMLKLSPFTLTCIRQTEFTIGFGKIPIYRSRPEEVDNELFQMLKDDGFASRVPAKGDRWLLLGHWNTQWKGGHGDLYNQLVRDRREAVHWSKADRHLSQVFWGEVLKHLRSGDQVDRYLAYDLLHLRGTFKTAADVRSRIKLMKPYISEELKDTGP